MNFKAIVVIGQTASGKTDLAHKIFNAFLEKNISCELVNLDAFQIYKDISTGTAKPSLQEQQYYHYHGIDICEINGSMDANAFARFLHNTCQKIYQKGKMPICVGGSGLYLRAFLHGLDQFPSHDPKLRQKIRDDAAKNGWEKCYEWLKDIDPVRASELHPNDHVRIERALEIYEICKIPPSQIQSKKDPLHSQNCLFDAFVIQTEIDQNELKSNIIKRTRELFENGWKREVQDLYQKYGDALKNFNSMRAIGYRTILDELIANHSYSQEDLIQKIATETAQYAKRQKTWNKKEKVDFLLHPGNNEAFQNLIPQLLS